MPIVDRDSAHFAQASRQIVETGNPFLIRFQNKPRHLKPPGIYWLQATSVKCFKNAKSNAVWPYRLPSALGGLLSVLLLFGFSRKFYGDKVAFFGAAFLASSLLLVIESHLCVTDAMLLASIVLMQGSLWKIYVDSHTERIGHPALPFLFWLGMAIGVLIKGVSPLYGLLTIITLSIVDRNVQWIKRLKPLLGLFLFVIFLAIWLVPVSIASHSNFLFDMIRGDVIPKLVGGQESHGMPPGFFFIIFSLMFWPASLFIWHANVFTWRHRKFPIEKFLIAWIIPSWIFFEIVPTKLPEYVLPLYPAIAVLTAKAIIDPKESLLKGITLLFSRIQYAIWALIGMFFVAAFLFVPYYFNHSISFVSVLLAALMIVYISSVLIYLLYNRIQKATVVLLLGIILIFGITFQFLLPSIKPIWISKDVAESIYELAPNRINEQKPLLSIGYNEPSLVFMLGTHRVAFPSEDQALGKIKTEKSELVLIDQPLKDNFIHKANVKNIKLKLLKAMSGYNYSRGKWITLYLYKGKEHEPTK